MKHILTRKDPTPKPRKLKKVRKFRTWFFGGVTPSDPLAHSGSVEPQFFWRNRFLKDRFTQKANRKNLKKKNFHPQIAIHFYGRGWPSK
jgi:hypothetical protein